VNPSAAGAAGQGELGSVLAVFFLASLFALWLTPPVRDLALRLGLVDRPDGRRKRHPAPVPRLGGLSVYLAFVSTLLLWHFLNRGAAGQALTTGTELPLVAAATAVMLVGLVDDLLGVPPAAKLLVQAGAGGYLYAYGFRIELLSNPFGEILTLGPLSLPLTLLWFVGLSNALNLIDGLDGLAAGIGLFAVSASLMAALVNDRWEIALLSAALGGALLGFLRYNLTPASVFLGDCGSLFLGFVLAALAVRGSMKSSTAIAVFAPLLALAIPILDTTLAMVRRVGRGRGIFEADTEHIHHRMVRRGLTPRRAVFVLYGVGALFGVLSLLTVAGNAQVVGMVVIVFSVVTWFGLQRLGDVELLDVQRRLQGEAGPSFLETAALLEVRQRLDEAASLDDLRAGLKRAAEALDLLEVEVRTPRQTLTVQGPQRQGPGREARSGGRAEWWAWTMSLADVSGDLGEVTVRGLGGAASTPADAVRFFPALSGELARALRRLLPERPAAASERPRALG
jgi:UDP-GlcNAc:undecaprenyl-phosphate GlcNAc-1-phosphate transferase